MLRLTGKQMRKNTLDAAAELRDLRHRVDLLESILHGQPRTDIRGTLLIRMYLEVHRIPGIAASPLAEAWTRQIYMLDARTLVALAREVNDPYPWRPFLALLDSCCARGVPGAADARSRLLLLAQDMLDLAGLGVLHPRDLMGTLRITEALSAISG